MSSANIFFHNSVEALLSNWTALQLAISQSAAGANSRAIGAWMAGAVVSWFQDNRNVEYYEASEMLEAVLNQEFNVIVEDGSGEEIGRLLCDFYSLIYVQKASEETIIARMSALPKCNLSECKVDGEVCNEESSMLMEVEPRKENSVRAEPDEDGWITVPTRNKK